MALSPVRRRVRRIKVATWLVCLIPLVLLGWDALRGHLGANPIERAINRLGYWALVSLLASLACTPAKLLAGWTWPLQVRRMLGLWAFFYGTAHLSMYLGVDQGFAFDDILADVIKRKFITIGMLTWLLLAPLALTSTDGWVRRLGFVRWKQLHRLAYAAGLAGCVHFLLRGKVITLEASLFMLICLVLLGTRAVVTIRGRKPAGAR